MIKKRLAVLLSHPIQYYVPLMRKLAANNKIELTVFFMTDTGLKEKYIKGYGETLKWDIELLTGYRYFFLKNISFNKNSTSFFSKINPEIILNLSHEKFDAILIYGYNSLTEWLALLTAKFKNIPVIFSGDVLLSSEKSNNLSLLQYLKNFLKNFWLKKIDAILVLKKAAQDFYEYYGVPSQKMFWTPFAVDNEYWIRYSKELKTKKRDLRIELGIDPDLSVILYVAHMREFKRPFDLIKAFERIATTSNMVMVGAGPLYEEVREYCDKKCLKRIKLVGAKNQTELPRYYAMADVFVMTSGPGETFGLVVNEAMCFSLPLLLSNGVPSSLDFVDEGQNGYVYKIGDINDLANKLDSMLKYPIHMAKMGQKSLEIVSGYTYEKDIEGILSALHFIGRRQIPDN